MNRYLILIAFFLLGLPINAQEEFSFQLYFEDAVGNRDTITLGYDPLATDTIDVAFGEENILNQPWSDSTLDVRIGNKMYTGSPDPLAWTKENTYQTKKQILSSFCNTYGKRSEVVTIQFRAKNLPIKVEWNPDIIPDSCRAFSCFFGTSADILAPPDAFNGLQLFYTSYPNFLINWHYQTSIYKELNFFYTLDSPLHAMQYFKENTDSIGIFKFIFQGSHNGVGVSEKDDIHHVQVYPNPTTNIVTIDIENDDKSELMIYKLDGTFIRNQTLLSNSNIISISDLNVGIYLFEIQNDKGTVIKKVIKN